jgi:hypothetical protein
MRKKMQWNFTRYRRLFWDCGLDPYYRLVSLRKRRREEKIARRHRKIGRPRIWTLRQAASAINSWGIDWEHFPRHDTYRGNDDLRPKSGIPATLNANKLTQRCSLENAADDCDLPGAPIQITDSGVDLLNNRQ